MIKKKKAQLLSDMGHHEHCLHPFLFKYGYLKVFVQLFSANLNFVPTKGITSPSVITVS